MLKTRIAASLVIGLILFSDSLSAGDQKTSKDQPPAVGLSDALLNRLPSIYREEAKKLVAATEETQQRWTKLSDEDFAASVIDELSTKPEGDEFVLSELEKEPSAKLRRQITESTHVYWASHLQAEKIVEHNAAGDPDAAVAIHTLELLRFARMNELESLFEARLIAAKSSVDSLALAKLGPAEEHWFRLEQEIMLPAFLSVPPPQFSVEPLDKTIRVLAFGDFGTGSIAQRQTAAAMVDYNKRSRIDFGITLGDNFYVYGMDSPSDPRWQTQWEQLYGPLGIKFYASLGNHDYGQPDSPAAEILYSGRSPDWRMPSPYYTFTAGPVQFFAIDTVDLSDAELQWLNSQLAKSQARWKVVYGHYPIYSATGEDQQLVERLLPVLNGRADVYLCGHHHNLQELKPEGGVHFFVSGGGGAALYGLNQYDRSIFKQRINGFTVLEADRDHFKVIFIGADGKELHSSTLSK
jgi:tartrate-resistant acid phosphatase type 5